MPIRPEKLALYPPKAEWEALRRRIMTRARCRCEKCGIRHNATGYRHDGKFVRLSRLSWKPGMLYVPPFEDRGHKVFRVVLTIAHLNHDPTDNRDENLAALCQRCHNRHDVQFRRVNRFERIRAPLAADMFPVELDRERYKPVGEE